MVEVAMLRRMALVFVLLILSGMAAIFAAGHFGIELPWNITVTKEPGEKASKTAKDDTQPGESKDAADTAGETAAALGTDGKPEVRTEGKIEIDLSRISPDGTSVFAGRTEPNTYVTVMEDGKPAGTVKADENGEWSLATEHKFASVDPKLSYETSTTPPPEPVKPAAPPAAIASTPSAGGKTAKNADASAVASEVMRKFENLVAEARKEAEAQKAAPNTTTADASPKAPADTPSQAAPSAPASSPDSPAAASPTPEQSTAPSATSKSTTVAEGPSPPAQSNAATAPPSSVAAPSSENTGAAPIPVPIMFVYNEATLTPEGEHAARLLLEYLQLKHLAAVELTGHADERGTGGYNYDLSRERLDTVSRILRDGGYGGGLNLIPKGETEPFTGVDRAQYQGEALFQLDRRVELRVIR